MAEIPIDWPALLPTAHHVRSHLIEPRATVTMMETGRPRVRKEYSEPLEVVQYVWNFTGDQFDIFKDYMEANLANGQNHFIMAGYEDGLLITRVVAFLEPYQFNHQDNHYQVQAVFEVIEEQS